MREESSALCSRQALDDVRVLDFTAVMAGPFATRMLADLGADVVKVESFEGDQVRARPPLRDGFSSYFGHLNAGKRSIALDLKSPEAVGLIKEMIDRFDVLVENFRPGVMRRLGLDFESLAALNRRLIYCSVSGYGQTGPRAGSPAYAPVIHAASGFDMVNLAYQDGATRPATSGVFIADVLGGAHAFGAIQSALYQREKTGRGQFIDVAMLDAMVGMLVFETQAAQFPGTNRRPLYSPLKTLDGHLMVAPTSPRNFDQLCEAIGHPEWRDDPRFRTNADRNSNWTELLALVEEWSAERASAEAEQILEAHGVPCSRYRVVEEVLSDPHLVERGTFAEISDGAGRFRVVNPPFRMSDSKVSARNFVSTLGQHGPEILRDELALSEADIAALKARGALG
jgi:crotonobetainyl-CoA:carnitine CoA-transferase CaiB-like acyl-CoA transferase